jgi:hypothetical protein
MSTYSSHLGKTEMNLQSHTTTSSAGTGWYSRLIEDLKFSHFGLISLAILFGSCLGGVAAMYVLMAGFPIWAVGVGLAASLANLVACIAQAPTRWVVNLFTFSVVVNLLLFILSQLA